VENDRQWQALSGIINEDWARAEGFGTMPGRKQREAEIDSRLYSWTSKQQAEELASRLQHQGIPAGVVASGKDITRDPQLAHRQTIWDLETEDTGRHAVFGQGFLMSKAEVPPPKPAPRLGEHSFRVCKEFLNMPDETIAELFQEGVLQST
jgi:crotonobetainyl-CoA:carnitine CoA-transferase CaiB-like acyl-CoA transferase